MRNNRKMTPPRGRRNRFYPAVFAAALILGLLAGSIPALPAQSLKEAVELALDHDPSVQSAGQAIRSAELNASSAFFATMPTLSLGASYQYATVGSELVLPYPINQTIVISPQTREDLSAGVTWPIFTGFAKKESVRMKRMEADLSANAFSRTRAQTALRTISAYRQAQMAALQIDTIGSGQKRVQLQLDQANIQFSQGMTRRVDVLSLSISKSDFDQKLIAARADLANAIAELTVLTGREIVVDASPETGSAPEAPPLMEEAADEIKVLAIQRGMRESARAIAQSKLYPTVLLNASYHYGYPGLGTTGDEWSGYATLGASLSWNWNWGGDILAAQAAEAELSRTGLDEAAVRDRIRLGYDKAVREYRSMADQLTVMSAALEQSRAKMAIVSSQYGQGMASTADFNDSNLELTQAELKYRSLLLALLLGLNQIDAARGAPLEQWSISQ